MKCIITAVYVYDSLAVWRLEDFYADSLHPSQHFFSSVETFLGSTDSKQGIKFLAQGHNTNILIYSTKKVKEISENHAT